MRITLKLIVAIAASILVVNACGSRGPAVTSTIIVGATIFDGTGDSGFPGAVRFDDDRIVAVGDLEPLAGETVVDAEGLILAPGFIDTHGHYYDHKSENRHMPAVLSQGVTTTVRGMDGYASADEELRYVSQADFAVTFAERPAAVNVASYAPHNSIRHQVMGLNSRRSATAAELAAMASLVEDDMRSGAIGLATGLEYVPGIFSSVEEVILLARVAASFGGSYASHLRDEDDLMMDAIDEAIRIGREAEIPVHVSHIKLANREFWGTTDTVIGTLEAARSKGIDVTADIYPYDRWAANLGILFPDRDFTNRTTAEFTFEQTAAPEDILLTIYAPNPEFEGLTIADIARKTERDVVTTLLELAQAGDEYFREHEEWGAMIVAKGMHEDDISAFMQWAHTNICSDGGYNIAHPRSYGSFPRVLGHYVRERGVLTMAQAIYKMSGLSAQSLGLTDRGLLRPGLQADLVLFDPQTITDNATMDEPRAVSSGVHKVWVNGVLAFADGESTMKYSGKIVMHSRQEST